MIELVHFANFFRWQMNLLLSSQIPITTLKLQILIIPMQLRNRNALCISYLFYGVCAHSMLKCSNNMMRKIYEEGFMTH
jgi:hypothetical protein